MPSHVFTFPIWVTLIPGSIALVILGVGVWIRRSRRTGGTLVIGCALFFGAFFGPMLLPDRIEVSNEQFDLKTGFWFAPTRRRFHFAEVDHVVIRSELMGAPRTTSLHRGDVWYVFKTDGESERMEVGDLLKLHSAEIERLLLQRGVALRRE